MDIKSFVRQKSTDALNIRVLFTKSNNLPPWRRSLTTVASLEVKISLFSLEKVFRRTDLSFIKSSLKFVSYNIIFSNVFSVMKIIIFFRFLLSKTRSKVNFGKGSSLFPSWFHEIDFFNEMLKFGTIIYIYIYKWS